MATIGIDCRMYSSNFTGIGRYTFELVKNLQKLDQENTYILFFNDPEYEKFQETKNFKKRLVNAKHYSLKEQTKFLKALLKEKLDLVHFPHFNVPILYRKPYIVTIHDLTLSFYPGKKLTKKHHRVGYHLTLENSLKTSKKIISVSENTKKDILTLHKISEEKIATIYNGLNPEFKEQTNQTIVKTTLEKYKIQKPFLLYTGVWRSHKNLTNLIRAFKKLREIYNLDIELVITGKEDPHYPEVKQQAFGLKLEQHVKFVGLVPEKDLVNLYSSAEIYCFPSLYEGFGLPPLEAMACKTPVAASNISSIPEICGKNNLVLFNPANVDDIAEKIYTLYTDKTLQEKLTTRGLEHIKQFSWQKMTESIHKEYLKQL